MASACDNDNPCGSRYRSPCTQIDALMAPLKNATGRWADFNPMVNRFIKLQALSRMPNNFLCEDDLTDPPSIGDYADLNLARTRTEDAPTC